VLGRWVASRALPVAERSLTRSALRNTGESSSPAPSGLSVEAVVARADWGSA
jgi:hypothetical protein